MPLASRTSPTLDDVLARADVWRGGRLAGTAIPAVASGFPELDAQLPGSGWPRGTLTEILVDQAGIGECSLLMPALQHTRDQGKWTLLVAPPHALCAAAWAAAGSELSRLLVASPQRPRDALWAVEQGLASGALGSVLCWSRQINPAQVRRLEVAVGGSDTLAFLFRPRRAQSESSASALRLLLTAAGQDGLAVDLLKRRGPPCTQTLYLKVARPLSWRENDESTLARSAFAVPAARSPRRTVAA